MPNNDYILRSKALKAVCETCSEHGEEGEPCAGHCGDYALIENIPAANAEPKRKWISVDEEEPEKDGEYFVLHSVFGRPVIEVMSYGTPSFFEEMRCFYRYDSEWGDVVVNDVSHWLPLSALPEPPKGENNAKQ